MLMNSPVVRSAGPEDEAAVLNVITLAFTTDPVARWANPEPTKYLAVMPLVARAFGGNGFAHGSVYVADDGVGAAMWLPPGVEPDGERLGALITETAPADIIDDLMAVLDQAGHSHPEEPHWYLPLFGVDPAMHGRGIGSALLTHALRRADADGVPAYLESSNPRNIDLYQRHGFEILRTIQVGSSPPVVPMLRRPRGA
jgi:ribosomal protein S18 acetylase RimI-like enzyme